MGRFHPLAILGLLSLLGQNYVNAQAGIGSDSAPFPDVTYPGAIDPLSVPGARSGQTSPSYYPSPWQDGSGGWEEAYQKAQEFVSKLTLLEKVNLTTGVGWAGDKCVGNTGSIPRLGFRALCTQDSPVGVRASDFSSVFSAGVTIAATWDRELFYQRGQGLGQEHYGKGVDVQLGPVVGPLGRAPEGGRNWEGFSPDPYLSGVAVAETVKGIQSAGVMACTKHYIGYEQEHFRATSQVVEDNGTTINIDIGSANVDDRTMHELYLWPFADAVRAGTASVMCSYNQLNNSVACQNSYALNYLLKGELGFQGFIMSDWSAQHSGVSSALAGLDMTMPGDVGFDSGNSFWGANLTIAVLNGTIPQWRLDDMASRIVAGWYYVGRDKNAPDVNFDAWTTDTYGFQHSAASEGYTLINEHVDVRGKHGTQIRSQAAAGTVMLKNNGALPLTGKEKLTAVFGNDAGDNPNGPNGCGDRGCDNGTLAMAWGSGSANFPYLVTPLTAIQNEVLSNNGAIEHVLDNWATPDITALARRVVNSGGQSVAIVFVNADAGEDYIVVDGNEGDRNNLTLWQAGDQLINHVTSECDNTIVIMHTVGAVDVSGFYDNPNVTAIIWAGIPGEQSGNSIADVLYGRVNPGGKLPFTIGGKRSDYGTDLLYLPNNGGGAPQEDFTEGVFIDYRSFDRQNITPIYEFGHGLSYTSFSYSNLHVQIRNTTPYTPNKGSTKPAPKLGTIVNTTSAYLYPADFNQIPLYIYPYLNNTDLRTASQDPDYGQPASHFTPPNSVNGSSQAKFPAGGGPGGNPSLYDVIYTVTATIKNTGSVAGDEVPQVYINHGGPDDPKVVLRGFDRITIPAGASRTFTADLVRRDIMNWDTLSQDWVVSDYPKTVYVGASSRKLYLSAKLPSGGGSDGW